jgi:hypothetical protein
MNEQQAIHNVGFWEEINIQFARPAKALLRKKALRLNRLETQLASISLPGNNPEEIKKLHLQRDMLEEECGIWYELIENVSSLKEAYLQSSYQMNEYFRKNQILLEYCIQQNAKRIHELCETIIVLKAKIKQNERNGQ